MYILYVDSPPLSTGFLPTDNEGLTILSYFTEGIKSFFTSSSLSAIRVVSSAYLRLLILLPTILIPACASFSTRSTSRLYIVTLLI